MSKNKPEKTKKQTTNGLAQTTFEYQMASCGSTGVNPFRAIAVSSGDYQIAVTKEVRRILDENRRHPLEAIKVGLERLNKSGFISSQERKSLVEVCSSVFASVRGEIDADEASARVQEIYDAMLIDETASPVALAITSSAAGSFRSSASPNLNPKAGVMMKSATAGNRGDLGLLTGAVVGAGIGGAIGGLGGAAIGGFIGGAIGAVVGACAE